MFKILQYYEKSLIISVIIYTQLIIYINDLFVEKPIHFIYPHDIPLHIYFKIIGFLLFEILLYIVLPGNYIKGPITPSGNKPVYKNNGLFSWIITSIIVLLFMTYNNNITNNITNNTTGGIFIENLNYIQKGCNYLAFIIVLLLYYRAVYFKNICSEPVYNNSFIIDFYKGIELHPIISKYNIPIKLIINSRFGMMLWGVIVVSGMTLNYSSNVWTSGLLQLTYITKFFIWENQYISTMDITHDRCGYFLFWGCICYVPCIYSSAFNYHFLNPSSTIHFNIYNYITLLIGTISIYINWDIDTQRTHMRKLLHNKNYYYNGNKIDYVETSYTSTDGKAHKQYLITSGYMGISRHFNYFFELLATLMWSLAGIIPNNIFAYTYFLFLFVLLVHRTYRDDERCLKKYGDGWKEYKKKVPFKIIPFIF
jgi:7-dehydrocholesterol reductase